MAESIPFSGSITFEDTLRARRLLASRKIFSTSGVIALLIILAIAMRLCTIILETNLLVVFIGLLASATFILALVWLMNWFHAKIHAKGLRRRQWGNYGTLSSAGIETIFRNARQQFDWDYFTGIRETDNLLVLVKDNRHYLVFAPYIFPQSDDWNQCRQLAAAKLKTV